MSRILGLLGAFGCIGYLVAFGDAWANPGLEGARSVQVQPYNRGVDQVLRGIRSRVRDAKYTIKVTDLGDFILLEGDVDSERSRGEVVAAARASTPRRIRDELRIRATPSDAQIADHLREALRFNHPRIADRVSVEVRSGVAYLSGDLKNHREVDELLSTALMVDGVADVKSDITLAGRPYAATNNPFAKHH